MRLEYEGLSKCEAVVNTSSRFYDNPSAFAIDRLVANISAENIPYTDSSAMQLYILELILVRLNNNSKFMQSISPLKV